MFRRILVTLDGSEFAEAALPAALGLARKTGAHLRMLTVHDSGWAIVHGEWADAGCARARRYLDHLRERVEPFCHDLSAIVRQGYAVDEILAEADVFNADLVVMATHGRGPLSRFWLGSIADQCLRRGHRPLLAVRPGENAAPLDPGSLAVRRVVVPVDGSEFSERALDRAMEVATLFDSAISLLRVVPEPLPIGTDVVPGGAELAVELAAQAEAEAEAEHYLTELADWLKDWGIAASRRVVVGGDVAPAIQQEARGDLVVMASHARTGLNRAFLGSVADAVVRSATGPVLVIPPEPAPARRHGTGPQGRVLAAVGD